MFLVLLPWLTSVSAKHPNICGQETHKRDLKSENTITQKHCCALVPLVSCEMSLGLGAKRKLPTSSRSILGRASAGCVCVSNKSQWWPRQGFFMCIAGGGVWTALLQPASYLPFGDSSATRKSTVLTQSNLKRGELSYFTEDSYHHFL